MTIHKKESNLLDSSCPVLVNTVNCAGVMGKGIALAFKKKYPAMFKDYKQRCAEGKLVPGKPYFYRNEDGRIILNFPTKDHWRRRAKLDYIEKGLEWFVYNYEKYAIKSIAFPALGCGNGGLSWEVVEPLMCRYLADLPIHIEVYLPYAQAEQEGLFINENKEKRSYLKAEAVSEKGKQLAQGKQVNDKLKYRKKEGKTMLQGYVKTSDNMYIYYEAEGSGQTIVLVHGWACSHKFYERNVAGLKDKFQVVTIDLRGHGKSSKGLGEYTVDRLARDVHEVIEHLQLEKVFLLGWSLGGPTLLSYWKQFGKEKGHLAALGLIDMTAYPFSSAEWNSHGNRNYNADALTAFTQMLFFKHEETVNGFVKKMFKDCQQPAGTAWVNEECLKLLPHLAISLYSDYCYNDYTDVLPTITVPVLVVAADSGIFPTGIKQGKGIAEQIAKAEFVPFFEGGHLLFWLEAEKFNRTLTEFIQKL